MSKSKNTMRLSRLKKSFKTVYYLSIKLTAHSIIDFTAVAPIPVKF